MDHPVEDVRRARSHAFAGRLLSWVGVIALALGLSGCCCGDFAQGFNEGFNEGFCESYPSSFTSSCISTCTMTRTREVCETHCDEQLRADATYRTRCLENAGTGAGP